MESKYLTVEEAVKELEDGGEVVCVKNSMVYTGKAWIDHILSFYNLKDAGFFRRPLTPEQIIKSGTPLLASIKCVFNADVEEVFRISRIDGNRAYYKRAGYEGNYSELLDDIKFVLNENSNYITIVDNVAKEVLR